MQDPRLSKYKNIKNLSKKTVEEIDTLSLNKNFSDSEIQGSMLRSWISLIKGNKNKEPVEPKSNNINDLKPGFIRKESKVTKIAKYFLAIGLEKSAKIMSELDDSDIILITREISKISYIAPEEKDHIIKEFEELLENEKRYVKVEDNFAYELLNKSLGKSKAKSIYKKVTGNDIFIPFDYLSQIEHEQLWALIKDENIKTLVILYNYLNKDQKKYIFSMLGEEDRKEFVKDLVKPRQLSMETIEAISNKIKDRFKMQGRLKTDKLDGSKILVDILSYMDSNEEKNLLNKINMQDLNPALDSEIREKIFDINVILRIMDNDLHNILREFTDKEIAIIIKDKTDEVRDKMLSNVSKRRKEIILDEETFLGKISKKDLKAMTSSFINYIKNLTLKGDLVIYRKNEEFV
ncbi:flagellar motor switch protein FliG [Borreliella lusitaniae]|uniref:flagellar motor switch protein FliG n=1 Tax=Borreliella lusitaniae TaxID=100177 RepID=UPI002930100E|nr:flagellar motor switch protein FliG [Borreliella lusitaniae]WNY66597.1 flagellar motor switch protein FliG [Borreliella lusitaniae]